MSRSLSVNGLAPPASRTRRKWTPAWLIGRVSLYLLLVVGAITFGFPFYWMIVTSLKPSREVYLTNLIPGSIHIENWAAAFSNFPMWGGLANTMIIVIGVEVGRLVSVPLAAYAFARLDFPFKGPLFLLVLSTMMLPYQVTLIPQFLIFRDLGWLNTYLPLIVPSFVGGGSLGAFSIFLLRQFFMSIPKEYGEAAELDGCGFVRMMVHIILPLSTPALAAIAILTFLQEWNDFFGPLVYLTSPSKYTLALNFQNTLALLSNTHTSQVAQQAGQLNIIMAIAALITIPPIAVFLFAQRIYIRGVVVSGIKG